MRRLARRGETGRYILISAGGIFSAEDAWRRIRLGATLVQVYTALIYEGPGLVKTIKQGLCELARRDGYAKVSDAIGVDVAVTAPLDATPADIGSLTDADFNIVLYPETASLAADYLERTYAMPAVRAASIIAR